jgi:hypothetical protein
MAGTVNEEQRCELDSSLARSSAGRLVSVNHIEESPPSLKQEASRTKNKNHREKKRDDALPLDTAKEDWTPQEILEEMSAAGVLQGSVAQCLSTNAENSHKLYCVTHKTYRLQSGAVGFTAVLTTPTYLRQALQLENPSYIKIAADATFKDVFGDCCLIPCGVLSKLYSRTTGSEGCQHEAWCSHFTPLLYAFSTTESAQAYTMLYETMASLPIRETPKICMGPNVRQVHADWSPASEAARKQIFAESLRAADFWHFWKNMQERCIPLLDHTNADGNKQHQRTLQNMVFQSRTYCTTLTEFHTFWYLQLKQMSRPVSAGGWGEPKAADYMRRHYFVTISEDDARKLYQASHLIGGQEGVPKPVPPLLFKFFQLGSFIAVAVFSLSGSSKKINLVVAVSSKPRF